MWWRCVALLVAIGVVSPGTASAASLVDPDARVFTLVPEGKISAVAAMADGGVVYATQSEFIEARFPRKRPGKVMWLTPGGVLRQVRAHGALALAVDRSGVILMVRERGLSLSPARMVERVDPMTGKATRLAALRTGVDAITVLDDGSVIAAAGGVWHIKDGGVRRVPAQVGRVQSGGLISLPGGRFAVLDGDLAVVDLAGRRRVLVPGFSGPLKAPYYHPIAASGDGGILATLEEAANVDSRFLAHVSDDGRVTRLTHPATPRVEFLGLGDGLSLLQVGWATMPRTTPLGAAPWVPPEINPRAMVAAADGSLVFGDDQFAPGEGLRAIVPATSRRPRIAFAQSGYASFAEGRVRYVAPLPGTASVTVRRGDTIVAQAQQAHTTAGEAEIALPQPLPPDRYDLRLRLTTGAGSAEAVSRVDTRAWLPRREALRALWALNDDDGDEGGGAGTKLDGCQRQAPLVIRCLMLAFALRIPYDSPWPDDWSEVSAPWGQALATLRPDGIRAIAQPFYAGGRFPPLPRSLRVSAARRQHIGRRTRVRLQVRTRRAARIRITVNLRWTQRGRSHPSSRTQTRTLPPGGHWRAAIRLPETAAAAARTGRKVHATLVVRLSYDTDRGPHTEARRITLKLLP
jgi:hypothetical protein